MTELSKNRVVIIDEVNKIFKLKTEAQIVQENYELDSLLKSGRKQVVEPNDVLKEAMREDDFQAFLDKKKSEKAEKAKKEVVEEVADIPPEVPTKKMVSEDRSVSLKFGVVGVGQAGSKLAKVFYDLGYDVCAINTAKQDLELLDIPDEQKFYMNYSIGGAGRDLDVGKAALEEDFDAVREFVDEHIGQTDVSILCVSGGGGCTSGDSMVFSTKSGLEPIENLYKSMAEKFPNSIIPGPAGQKYIDVSREDIKTYSLKKDGTVYLNKINEVWFNGVKDNYIAVKTKTGEHTVTPEHPFFIFENNEIAERAAKDIKIGDRLIGAGPSPLRKWVNNDEDAILAKKAWLYGALLGDGHFHKTTNRFDITAETEVCEKALDILKSVYGYTGKPWIDRASDTYEVYQYQFNSKSIRSEILSALKLTPGRKCDRIFIPQFIQTSSLDTIGAFVAGLIDTDGSVSSDKCGIRYTTASKLMAEQLVCLLNIFNSKATLAMREPYGKGKIRTYDVYIWGQGNMEFITKYVAKHMINIRRINLLNQHLSREQGSFASNVVPVRRDEFTGNVDFRFKPNSENSKQRFWAHSKYISVGNFGRLLALNTNNGVLDNIYDCMQEVEEVRVERSPLAFYDLSMDNGDQNYLAGKNDLTFIHNTGAGAASTMVGLLSALGRPVIVLYVLPGSSDDSQSKHNAIKTLAELADLAAKQSINSLILVDNAKIEAAYPSLSQATFWKTANSAIVDPLHMFNSVTAKPTDYEALDSMDFAKSLLEAGNCVLFGSNKVSREKYEGDETALVEAIVDNLEHGLLASGFDLKEAQTVGVLVTAKQEVLEKVPYHAISYIFKYIADQYDSARTYKGVYALPSEDDDITIHFIFSGMGLPKDRVDSLKNEAKKHMENLHNKKKTSSDKMSIDLGKDKATSASDDIMDRIKKKKGAMGKLITSSRKPGADRRR